MSSDRPIPEAGSSAEVLGQIDACYRNGEFFRAFDLAAAILRFFKRSGGGVDGDALSQKARGLNGYIFKFVGDGL